MAERSTFLTAEWKYLVMLNYEIDPDILSPFIPAGTQLDLWKGKSLVSMVGFLFLNTKVLGISIPFHRNFEEVNLRFYVKRQSGNDTRRGVVFIRELVPRFAIATVARLLYNERYLSVPMNHKIDHQTSSTFQYAWKYQGQWNSLEAKTIGAPKQVPDGSEESFITEHYWGYTAQRDGRCSEYRVEHPQWKVWNAEQRELKCDVAAMYGQQFVECLKGEPTSAFVAEGSPVVVRKGNRIE
jgi:uncharacterized protein